MFVNELKDGAELDQVLLVREAERRQRRDGGDYLRLTLGDRSGAVACMVWEELQEIEELARPGMPVRVRGRYTVHPRFGPQVNLRSLQEPAPGSYALEDLRDGPARTVEQMEDELRELLGTVRQEHLRELLERVFGAESQLWAAYRVAPAAKHYHQAYRHGLLEHSLSVAQGVSAIGATFGGIDRDVAVTGALLHDIGKLEAYTLDPSAIDLTDQGRLQGEIALGYYRVRRLIEEIDEALATSEALAIREGFVGEDAAREGFLTSEAERGFPGELAQAVLHIVLSHHGSLEHGSPVAPCTREATLVHMVDNLGGRLGSFDRLEKSLAPGKRWSSFDRALDTSAFFGVKPQGDDGDGAAEPQRQAA